MDAHDHAVPRIPTTLVRGVIAVALLGAFFLVASIINPDKSRAADGNNPADLDNGPRFTHHLDSDQPDAQTTLLGTLLGTIYTVEIHGTDRGIRYTVIDDAGKVLIELATPEDVQRVAPDLDLESLRANQIGEVDTNDYPGLY